MAIDLSAIRPDVARVLLGAFNEIWPPGFLGLKLQLERDIMRRCYWLFIYSSRRGLAEDEMMTDQAAADAHSGVVWLDTMIRLGGKVCGELQGRAAANLRADLLLGLDTRELPACLRGDSE